MAVDKSWSEDLDPLCCPGCGRFLLAVDGDMGSATIGVKCPNCKSIVQVTRFGTGVAACILDIQRQI